MGKAQIKDFFVEIKKSLNRYLSIMCISALGVAFFAGVRSTEPDMRITVDTYLDQMNFMDIRVVSTLGLTEDDIDKMSMIEGVDYVNGGFESDFISVIDDSEKVIKVMSITDDVNEAYIIEGSVPQKENECIADSALASSYGFRLGDSITVVDEDEALSEDTYIITGFAMSPFYLTFQKGNTSVGNGSIAAFIMIYGSNFTQDYYNQAYIRSDLLKADNSYGDEYKEKLEALEEEIEKIAGDRCEIRFAAVKEELTAELESGEAEYAEASSEAAEKLESGAAELESAAKELESGEYELESAKAEYETALLEIESGEKALEEGKTELETKKLEIEKGEIDLESGEKLLADTYELLETSQKEYESGAEALKDAKWQYQIGSLAYSAGSAELEVLKAGVDSAAAVLEAAQSAYESGYGSQTIVSAAQSAYDSSAKLYEEQKKKLDDSKELLDIAEKEIPEKEKLLEDAKKELDDGWEQYRQGKAASDTAALIISEGKKAIITAEEEIIENEKKLIDGRAELAEAEEKIQSGEEELSAAREEYDSAKEEYDSAVLSANEELSNAREKLDDGQKMLSELEVPKWYVLDRDTVQTYVEYGTDAERIGAIGKVFPIIFFLVAALICLTTMTRMVEEQRTQIGTMKALGYSTLSIAMKYLMYALTASIIGSIVGALIGGQVFPRVIIMAYGMLYSNIPLVCTPNNIGYSITAAALAVLCISASAFAACFNALRSQAAELMRPVAPKQGKKILLERIDFIWKHLNFSKKAALRNLFRYKKRLFMTIFGIGACTALLIVGFGLRDAISAILDNQYERVWMYNASITVDKNAEKEALDKLDEKISKDEEIDSALKASITNMDAMSDDAVKSVYVFVPENMAAFGEFVSLHDRKGGKEHFLGNDDVIISEKLSMLLGVEVGDTFTIKEDDTKMYELRVGAIAESYLYHYVYMSPALYENVFGDEAEYNQILLKLSCEDEDKLAERILEEESVVSVGLVSDTLDIMGKMLSSLDAVVWVLIISAGLLAFVVLYNLNNINITERIRELATLKVLGFYDGEVAAYVYRENVLLTVIGTFAGLFFGRYLQAFVIETAELDIIMFGREISFMSYVLSAVITVIFAVIVNWVMNFRLKKIDMIESLKSVE